MPYLNSKKYLLGQRTGKCATICSDVSFERLLGLTKRAANSNRTTCKRHVGMNVAALWPMQLSKRPISTANFACVSLSTSMCALANFSVYLNKKCFQLILIYLTRSRRSDLLNLSPIRFRLTTLPLPRPSRACLSSR